MTEEVHKPFRFGVVGGGATAKDVADCARRAETFGYSVYLSSDHLDLSGSHFSELAPFSALTYAATVTTRIRLGTSVINQDLRHPAVLAREVASLDILSSGRFELGLGAGHTKYEYDWSGIPFDLPRVRVDRFEEYLHVVKSLLENDVTSFEGKHFHISDMPGVPHPAQRPRPPIMVGGTGKRMLTIAAREADIVGINLNGVSGTSEMMDERIEWVRAAAGGDLSRVELNSIVATLVVEDGDQDDIAATDTRTPGRDFMVGGLNAQELADSPIALVGTVDELVTKIQRWRDRWGISYVIVTYPMMDKFAPVVAQLTGR